MRRPRLLYLLLFAILSALVLFSGALVVLHCWDPTWPTRAAWDGIQVGMTEEEVIRILGKPASKVGYKRSDEEDFDAQRSAWVMEWHPSDTATCWITLDAERRVVAKSAYILSSQLVEEPTTLEAIVKRFGF